MIAAAGGAVLAELEKAARDTGTALEIAADLLRAPARMDPHLLALAAASARDCGFAPLALASVAGHDAVALQNSGIPSALVFVPSAGGIAHHPDELTEGADMRAGLAVLTALLRRLLEDPAALPAGR